MAKAKEQRTELIGVRVTAAERAEIEKAADKAKAHTLTDFVRGAALEKARAK